ncbi:histidinol-phosphatase [Lutibaculum baratangense]|uniref:Histidinol-phosphatase n=1 Tax=Lutibaculum baratangense AMV1 TaxID=631454 RepID=V4QWV8_9HYPH|nr:histidinol-phosphatase [Lutibaculum baratangense]ESR24257.1 Histidinol-phosphatase [Lutibaculum baratangense AMV1]
MDFREFEDFAHRLADAAAAVTLRLFRGSLAVDDKGATGFDPVTEADRGAEAAMRDLIAAEYPDHGVLGEEFEETRSGSGWRWVLDPLDGTRSFISGIPLWTTIIGLEKDGEPVFGLVDQPYVGDRFWGDGSVAYRRDRFGGGGALKTRPCAALAEATLMTTTPEMMPDAASLARYESVEAEARLVRYSADAYAYMMVAAGRVDLVVEAGLKPYDIVGIIPILRGAGGFVTAWDGGPASAGGHVVAAGDRALHGEAMRRLSA